jgi:hypothetical protein
MVFPLDAGMYFTFTKSQNDVFSLRCTAALVTVLGLEPSHTAQRMHAL